MGHQKLIRQNIRPTKPRSKIHKVGVVIIGPEDDGMKNMIAMDLPGRFPKTSASGNKYIFIMYDCNSDYIKTIAMKSRETDEMIRCYGECYEY